jgi:hypothetical protein
MMVVVITKRLYKMPNFVVAFIVAEHMAHLKLMNGLMEETLHCVQDVALIL